MQVAAKNDSSHLFFRRQRPCDLDSKRQIESPEDIFVEAADLLPRIEVDFARKSYYPALKSRIGFARAVSYEKLPETVALFGGHMRPGMFCTEIDFDHNANAYQMDIPTYWSVWNEPVHSLRYTAPSPQPEDTPCGLKHLCEATPEDRTAASKGIVNIYHAYFKAIESARTENDAQLGMASFIAAAAKLETAERKIFLKAVFDEFELRKKNNPSLDLDFISFNSYFGDRELLLSGARNAAENHFNHAPFIFTQYAPRGPPKDPASDPNSAGFAASYLTDLEALNRHGDVEHVCFSYWAGDSKKSFVRYSDALNAFTFNRNYQAIDLYMKTPILRSELTGLPATVSGIAARG